MKTTSLHFQIIEAIKNQLPAKASISTLLIDVLDIGKEAAYRRLRGEVPFTLDEAAILATHLNISLDTIIRSNRQESKHFLLNSTRFIDPQETDYKPLELFVDILHKSRNDSHTETGSSTNIFPQTLYLGFKGLTKFYNLKWLYQTQGIRNVRSLDDIGITPRMYDIQQRYLEEAFQIKYTYYIWDHLIFHYLTTQIKYFARIRYISEKDVLMLKEELFRFVDKLESIAIKGQFDSGQKVQFYLSPINFECTYSYLSTENLKLSLINVFTLDAATSLDTSIFCKLKSWIESQKRLSTLISESGEIERINFFNEQRDLISTL
ncbi:helix-turn-helix domain-containing protein [Dysgonomonas sp. 511]|uniref:helix-turn-helix domain-containing protein n=1 Tax=Dysgonomonas sp. 511 TaxID=2302930 RepID=UPI0013D60764|nr:helix-turn-helix domain-containing protein [Dysgonomonas sp. 511]NDV79497.1 hypothetical protein [Dysgonomonas sp. 511]